MSDTCDLPTVLTILESIAHIASVAGGTDEIAERTIGEIVPRFGLDGAAVLITHGRGAEFSILAEYLPNVKPSNDRMPFYASAFKTVGSLRSGIHTVIDDRVLAAPLAGNDRPLGAILFFLPRDTTDKPCTTAHDVLSIVATQLGYCLHNSILMGNYREKLHLEQEMLIAEEVAEGIMPKKTPEAPGYEIAVYYRTANRIGGDYYDIVETCGARLFVVADATGHGPGASLIIATLRAIIKTLAQVAMSIEQIVDRVNAILYEDLSLSGNSVAALFLLLGDDGSVNVVLAGSHHPLIARHDGSVVALGQSGPLLGTTSDYRYLSSAVTLGIGETLFVFTDGIVEQKDPYGEMLGSARIAELFGRIGTFELEAMTEILSSELAMHAGSTSFEDDVTFALLRTKPVVKVEKAKPVQGPFTWEPRVMAMEALGEFNGTLTGWLSSQGIEGELRSNLLFAGRELLANALRYVPKSSAFCRAIVRIKDDDAVILELSDNGPVFALDELVAEESRRISANPHDKESGRGLYLVSQLASRLHLEELVGRKKIVATFSLK